MLCPSPPVPCPWTRSQLHGSIDRCDSNQCSAPLRLFLALGRALNFIGSIDRCDSNQCSAPLRLFLALGRALNFMALLTGVTQTSALPLSACSLPLDTLSTSLALLTGVTQTSALPLSACSLPLDALSTSLALLTGWTTKLLEDGVYSFDRCDSNQCSAPLRLFLALGRALNFMALLTGVTQTSALPLSACSLPLDALSTSWLY